MDSIQEKLANQDFLPGFLAMTQGRLVSNLGRMETIHARIKRLRTAINMTMEELATKSGYKSWQTVQQWESDDPEIQTAPKRSKQAIVARILGDTVDELMFGTVVSKPSEEAPSKKVRRLGPRKDPAIAEVERLMEAMDETGRLRALRHVRAIAEEYLPASKQNAQ